MNDDDDVVVRVTLRTIYDTLLEMKSTLDPLPAKVNDHEVRIRAIEKYLWIWIGASGVLGAGVGQLLNTILGK